MRGVILCPVFMRRAQDALVPKQSQGCDTLLRPRVGCAIHAGRNMLLSGRNGYPRKLC